MSNNQPEKSPHELLLEKIKEQQEAIKLETLKYQERKAAAEAEKAASEAEKTALQAKVESEKPKVSDEELLKQEQALVGKATAEAEKAAAEAEKAAAEARKAALDELVPSGTAQPKEGSITVGENSGYFAALAAYQATRCLAREITNEIDPLLPAANPSKILITDSMEFCGSDVLLLQIKQQLNYWQDELENRHTTVAKLLSEMKEGKLPAAPRMEPQSSALSASLAAGPPAMATLAVLGGVLSATADIIGYFKTDYSIIGKTVAIDDLALRASLAGDLRTDSRQVYFPCFHRVTQSTVLDLFAKALEWRKQLQQNLDLLKSLLIEPLRAKETALSAEIEAIQAQLKKLKAPEDQQEIDQLQGKLAAKQNALQETMAQKVKPELEYARAEGSLNAFDAYNEAITSVAAGSSYSLLAQAAIRGWLDDLQISHLLFATVASSGGELVTSKNFFRTPKLGFLAGSVVSYVLATTAGTVISANTHVSTEYVKFDLGQDHPPAFKKCSELASNAPKA